jgi:hypothetical protein
MMTETKKTHVQVLLEFARSANIRHFGIGDAIAPLCESALSLPCSEEERQALAFTAADLYGPHPVIHRQKAIALFELAASIDGPLTARAALFAGYRCIDDHNWSDRVWQPERAIKWLELARKLNEGKALLEGTESQTGVEYLDALEGLIQVHTHDGIESHKRLALPLVNEIADIASQAPNIKVRDRARWALDNFSGHGDVLSRLAKAHLSRVGTPSNYLEVIGASV